MGGIAGSVLVVAAEVEQDLPAVRAQVTLPYEDFRALWTAAEPRTDPAEAPPPVAGWVSSADYVLVLGEEQSVLKAKYAVQGLKREWTLVPLLGGAARVEQVETDGVGVIWKDGEYWLITEDRGERSVFLRCSLPSRRDWMDEAGVCLRPGSASRSSLRVTGIPKGTRLMLDVDGVNGVSDGEGMLYVLPPGGGELRMRLEKDRREEVTSEWTTETAVVLDYHGSRLAYEARVHARAADGSGVSMKLWLPAGVSGVEVQGEDLEGYNLGEPDRGRRPLALRWKTREILEREFTLHYELPQSPMASEWILRWPQAEDGSSRAEVVMARVEGAELSGEGLVAGAPGGQLPDWMRRLLAGRAFLTARADGDYPIQVRWLPRVETAEVTVKRAECRTEVVTDGAMLVTAVYQLDHQDPLDWSVRLPAGADLLRCEVNGRTARPVRRDSGSLELPLVAPEGSTTRVSFSYAARLSLLDPVSGQLELSLPLLQDFIHELEWTVWLPATYEVTAVQGNAQVATRPEMSGMEAGRGREVLSLEKHLIRGEAPSVEVYYRRRGLDE